VYPAIYKYTVSYPQTPWASIDPLPPRNTRSSEAHSLEGRKVLSDTQGVRRVEEAVLAEKRCSHHELRITVILGSSCNAYMVCPPRSTRRCKPERFLYYEAVCAASESFACEALLEMWIAAIASGLAFPVKLALF
jgi:hypothetical protein